MIPPSQKLPHLNLHQNNCSPDGSLPIGGARHGSLLFGVPTGIFYGGTNVG
jgi:hypothetical protein